jgi:hypothetical protein
VAVELVPGEEAQAEAVVAELARVELDLVPAEPRCRRFPS